MRTNNGVLIFSKMLYKLHTPYHLKLEPHTIIYFSYLITQVKIKFWFFSYSFYIPVYYLFLYENLSKDFSEIIRCLVASVSAVFRDSRAIHQFGLMQWYLVYDGIRGLRFCSHAVSIAIRVLVHILLLVWLYPSYIPAPVPQLLS